MRLKRLRKRFVRAAMRWLVGQKVLCGAARGRLEDVIEAAIDLRGAMVVKGVGVRLEWLNALDTAIDGLAAYWEGSEGGFVKYCELRTEDLLKWLVNNKEG